MIPVFKLYPGALTEVMQTAPVRAAIRERADQVLERAQQLAAQPPVYEVKAHIEEDIRPKGRPYARIVSPDADQEFGTWGKKRRRILGRAAFGGEP